ncbi:MAG: efflux RND transporter periplasmic adaptor subunit [Gammaproteobacteria bacterium]|nr:efflux RND transporter periplasmic adaptor subunit [Gammaproteobacteria bacterium]
MYNYLKIISFIVCVLFFGCEQKSANTQKDTKQVKYDIYTVQSAKFSDDIEQISVIKPLTHDVIISNVTGFITKQMASYGADVKEGDALFVISDSELSTEVFNKLADYRNAQWDNESNQNKYQDYKLQYSSGLVAFEEVKLKEIEAKRAQMKLIQAEFELKQIANKINKTFDDLKVMDITELKNIFLDKKQNNSIIIKSPNDGTLIPLDLGTNDPDKISKTGSKVEGGQAFAALANLNRGEVQIELDESQLTNLKTGMNVTVKSLSNPNLQLTGIIKTIKLFEFNQKSDNLTRYPVTILVDSKKNIIPGTRCKITIPMPNRSAPQIPIAGVNNPYKLPFVLMADGTKRNIVLGKTDLNHVEIIKGLSPNEQILVPINTDKPS